MLVFVCSPLRIEPVAQAKEKAFVPDMDAIRAELMMDIVVNLEPNRNEPNELKHESLSKLT